MKVFSGNINVHLKVGFSTTRLDPGKWATRRVSYTSQCKRNAMAVTNIYRRVPDVVIMNGQRAGQPNIKAVGEIKSPWVRQHILAS